MMATVPHVTSGSGLGKFQADGFLSDRVYNPSLSCYKTQLQVKCNYVPNIKYIVVFGVGSHVTKFSLQ